MRKLMWFALGFVAACVFCAYFWLTGDLWISVLIMTALFAGAAVLGRRLKILRCVAAVCLGCAAGFAWFQVYSAVYLAPAAALDGRIDIADGRILDAFDAAHD